MSLGWQQCWELHVVPNGLLILIFTLIVIPAGYFYARHCGVYSIDEHGKICTKIWIVFSQYVVPYMLVMLWCYYSFRGDVNYVGRHHPWLTVLLILYLSYSVTTTVTFAVYCHPSKQLYSTWLFVCLVLLLFPATAILIALFVSEEEHKVEQFDAGLSQTFIRLCFSIDIKSFIVSCCIALALAHHIYVLIQTLFAPIIWNKNYLDYEPYYYSQATPIVHFAESSSGSSEVDYNYREKVNQDDKNDFLTD